MCEVFDIGDGIVADRLVEARPAAAGVILGLGHKQRRITDQAVINTITFVMQ
ncbi:hypothetical protein D3C75_1314940 [compost metagenome]